MITLTALIATYITGFLICYWMLRVDHESEGMAYTYGARVLNILFSLLSFGMILILLITSWYKLIGIRGYWAKTIKSK